jgi:hypothetical protein
MATHVCTIASVTTRLYQESKALKYSINISLNARGSIEFIRDPNIDSDHQTHKVYLSPATPASKINTNALNQIITMVDPWENDANGNPPTFVVNTKIHEINNNTTDDEHDNCPDNHGGTVSTVQDIAPNPV